MSISNLSLVNQKLAFAGAVLRLLSDASSSPKGLQRIESQALGDAAVFHMMMALHFYLREIAEHHQIRNSAAISSIQDLATALQQIGKISSEAAELFALAESGDSWLGQIIQHYNQLALSPQKAKEKKAFVQENLVPTIEVDEISAQPQAALTLQSLMGYFESFRALIARQRETSAEY